MRKVLSLAFCWVCALFGLACWSAAAASAIESSESSSINLAGVARAVFVPYGPNSIMEPRQLFAELDDLDYQEPVVSDEEFLSGARSIAMYVPRAAGEAPLAIDITIPAAALTPVGQLLERAWSDLTRAHDCVRPSA